MRDLIYYPSFEVQNKEWLKFALIYLNRLDPIVPESGDVYLSDEYRMIVDETDLIQRHRPNYEEGTSATIDAVGQIDRILRNPEAYNGIFSGSNFLRKWKDQNEQNFTLFREKYSDYWESFCLENKIGRRSHHGLMLSRDVANIYMTILAQCVADSRGISPITDNRHLDRFSIFSNKASSNYKNTMAAAQGVINLKLPGNLKDISLSDIVKLRSKPSFKKQQKSFHNELEIFLKNAEQGINNNDFEKSLGSTWSDFSDEIARVGTGTVAFGLGVWLMFDSSGENMLRAWDKMAAGSLLTVGSVISIRNTWNTTKTRRMTRRYLADIQDLALVTG